VAVWVFVRAMDRQLVRARFSAAEFPSRRVYATDEESGLAPLRQHIRVLELEGALFFGSADRLLDECERLPPATATLIVDLRRVTTVDASGVSALVQLTQRLAERGIRLRLSGVLPHDRHGVALTAHGVDLSGGDGLVTHANLDRAIEAAEQDALAAAMPGRAARMPLAQTHLFDGLDARQAQVLGAHMVERHLAAGERLFAQGDPGDHLYVLTAGSISVVDGQRGHRYVSFSPGMFFGEIALLDRGGRTADAVADVASAVYALPAEAFAQLQREEPGVAAQVYRNLATNLSHRLRIAGAAWWHAAA
jgi:anti-anti-sigma regulatory factor